MAGRGRNDRRRGVRTWRGVSFTELRGIKGNLKQTDLGSQPSLNSLIVSPPLSAMPHRLSSQLALFRIVGVLFIANQIAVVPRRSLFNILSAAVWIPSEDIPHSSRFISSFHLKAAAQNRGIKTPSKYRR